VPYNELVPGIYKDCEKDLTDNDTDTENDTDTDTETDTDD